MPTANLAAAAEGVMRAAFGLGGQKCSACSRVYVHKQIHKPFLEALLEKTKACKIGDPRERDTFLGPLINKRAIANYQKAVALERSPLDIGVVSTGVALGYVDFRFPAEDWRQGRPRLAAWHATFADRPSMTATRHADVY